MTRTIVSRKDMTARSRARGAESATAVAEARPDDYKQRLIKYIPAEVIALHLTLDALLRASGEGQGALPWAVFAFCFAATPLYLWRVAGVGKASQLLISTVAFAVWIFAVGGPFAALAWYKPIYGGILLPAYTFLIPIFTPGGGAALDHGAGATA